MKTVSTFLIVGLAAGAGVFLSACSKTPDAAPASAAPAKHAHEHHAPHGGTAVVLGDEVYHLELVLDASSGQLKAYVLDGEMENFIRSSVATFEMVATVAGEPKTLTFSAVADSATGETVGNSALFQAQADWLKTTPVFDAVLKSIVVRGTPFTDVKFNFPRGNDKD